MSVEKLRLDQLLASRGLFPSREKAQGAISDNIIYVDGKCATKPSATYPFDTEIEVRGTPLKYVSRGGLKLEKAISVFELKLDGKVAADIGASTGGFTDCMLQNGAAKVYAIDVGSGQLAEKLRNDSRVVNMEKMNIRDITSNMLEPLDFVTVDVSFISLKIVLPFVLPLLRDNASTVALIKPQFEAGKGNVGKKGVVRNPSVHKSVLDKFITEAEAAGFSVTAIYYSPVRGPEGNIEYLALLSVSGVSANFDTAEIVKKANSDL